MHPFRRLTRATYARIRYALGNKPEAETANSARSIATMAAARIANLRRQYAAHNDHPGRFATMALWGGSHPIIFAAIVGLGCAILALACWPAPYPHWAFIPFPDLPSDYTNAAFFGTIWSVQATLIALVYPIVLTFVPILLQRRASSKFALAFYMRDSAVLPAGTSSLLFLLVLTVQYLAAYYVPKDLFLFFAVFDGFWLLTNIGMTGYFLVKTVRYVEEDVGESTYRRLSLGYILWSDLEEAQKANLYKVGGTSIGRHGNDRLQPRVLSMAIHSGEPTVFTTLSGKNKLIDVDLFLVSRVASTWAKRANGHVAEQGSRQQPPTLELLPSFWSEYSGLVPIARVTNGPDLTQKERHDLLQAYVFAPPPSRFFIGDTKGVLEELASEVQSQLEQGSFDEAAVAFRKFRRLHEAFLHSSNTDQNSSLASAPAPWSAGFRSIGDHWLDPYRSLFEVAASKLSANQGLWRELCRLPANLVRDANPKDFRVTYEILEQYELIDHFLGTWWTREAHRSQAVFGATGAQLPEPIASDYRGAVMAVVNGLNVAAVPSDDKGDQDDLRWAARLRATVTWMMHVDICARLLIGTVRRGDKVAAEWYSDCLSHWLSDRAYEYGALGYSYTDDLPSVHVDKLDVSWSEARKTISTAIQREATLEDAVHVLWASLQQHWEVARLTSALLLMRAEVHGPFQELAHSIASRVLNLTFFTPGPSADAPSLLNPDLLLSKYLRLCCLDPHSRKQSASLTARILRRGSHGPFINGWSYVSNGYQSDPESLARQFMTLLLASTDAGRFSLPGASSLCRNLQELDTMRDLSQVLTRLISMVRRPVPRELPIAAASLRTSLGSPERKVSPMLQWRRKLKNLLRGVDAQIDAELRKIVVPPDAARTLVARLETELLNPTDGNEWNGRIPTSAGTMTKSQEPWSIPLRRYEKATFLKPSEDEFRQNVVQQMARQIAWGTLPLALSEALEIERIKPIEGSLVGEQLLNLVAAIRAEHWAGRAPTVLVPRGHAIDEMRWKIQGRSAPPHGVEFTMRESTDGPFEQHMVNGAPIFFMETPQDQIYLVPLTWFDCLVFERHADGTVLQHEFEIEEPDSVLLRIHWRAELSGAFNQT